MAPTLACNANALQATNATNEPPPHQRATPCQQPTPQDRPAAPQNLSEAGHTSISFWIEARFHTSGLTKGPAASGRPPVRGTRNRRDRAGSVTVTAGERAGPSGTWLIRF